MRKGFIFGGILCITLLSYLLYHSCNRDTLVIAPNDRISFPDSCWIYGTINLKQIKKEVAWSSLLRGDLSFLLHSDTLSNTLIKVLKSPNTYSIIEQNNLLFFSEWKKPYIYSVLSFKLNGIDAIKIAFKSDSLKIETSKVYSFRTQEGFWMYNAKNLIFIASQVQDSVYALHLFQHKHINIIKPFPSDSILAKIIIRTVYLPDSLKHVLLDSANIEIALKQNDNALQLDWIYMGKLADGLTQSTFSPPHPETGFFLSSTQTINGINKLLAAFDTSKMTYKKNKQLMHVFKTALNENRLRIEFNGWKKMKTSYFICKMNDEFEMVMQKVDTTFIEPLFQCTLEQKNSSETNVFLSFLKKEGLITKGIQNSYSVVFGNFDSELTIEKNNSIRIENKHKYLRMLPIVTQPKTAALYLELKPAYVQGLFDVSIQKRISSTVLNRLNKIECITIQVNKDSTVLKGSTHIRFNAKIHPIIALMGLLKE
jgi:hypothetical protein